MFGHSNVEFSYLCLFLYILRSFLLICTSLTGILSDQIRTGYESIYVTFQNKKLVFFYCYWPTKMAILPLTLELDIIYKKISCFMLGYILGLIFATVDPSPQKINISIVGQTVFFGNAKKVGEIRIWSVVNKINERKNNLALLKFGYTRYIFYVETGYTSVPIFQ